MKARTAERRINVIKHFRSDMAKLLMKDLIGAIQQGKLEFKKDWELRRHKHIPFGLQANIQSVEKFIRKDFGIPSKRNLKNIAKRNETTEESYNQISLL